MKWKRTFGTLILLPLLASCVEQHEEKINACHERVHQRAKNTAEIVTTEVKEDKWKVIVRGKVKYQNGFGAWVNYKYVCTVFSDNSVPFFEVTEGW
ncbi:hypothetical protein ACFOD1_07530 [Pseudidiomarina halophila]|uniref:Lipoprotein n=1 Tax=Pseudidiomarina halophila TaxID=1449799 RepID=A0A432XRC8_9GAMM|nr:hypothetical protein [Pseudidiomarina halophila]RUO51250.1 hypothetical protein CWI69_12035 [Pseudidiomarina halophila]